MPAENKAGGRLQVESSPTAGVYVEGIFAGNTPLEIPELKPGSYRIVVMRESYDDYVEDVRIAAGNASVIQARWVRTTKLRPSPIRKQDDSIEVDDVKRREYAKAKSVEPLRKYKVLEIANTIVKTEEKVPAEFPYALLPDLAVELDKKTDFEKFVTNFTSGASAKWISSSEDNSPALVLSSVITQFDPGSRATRYFVGFGAGKTRIYCLFRLVDKATNRIIFERMENGSVSMGVLGGSSRGIMKELATDIAKAIKQNW
ncbi:MAG: DUF4410 domain-containing protein [Acidobacteria bacterium]|nr:DUF4410 domain-containing protein [Acidobacteriota bacterium]